MKRDELLSYLQTCVSENLTHARHVENERLTFTSIYVATTIGAVAAVFALSDRWVAVWVAFALFLFSLMAIQFNARWQSVFNFHQRMAAKCQIKWIRLQCLGEKKEEITESDLAGEEDAIDLYGKQKMPQMKLCGCEYLFSYPKKKHDFWQGHTSHLFSLLYHAIAILMVVLVIFLHRRAIESPTGAGLYFSDSDRITLEAAINYFMEKLQVILK